jgi:hypothetical protein
MESEAEKRCRLLAETVCGIYRKGVTLDPEAVHFIDATFSTHSIHALKEMMTEAGDSQGEILGSFIFFPDETIQVQLEELLESQDFKKCDEKKVLAYLLESLPETPVNFPDDRGTLYATMPASVAEQFITRLNISKKLDRRILEAICRNVPENQRLRKKVKLRSSRFTETENRRFFLCRFFEKMKDDDGRCFEFVLNLFEERQDQNDVYELLTNKKRFYFQSIQKAKRYEDMLKESNMETLMLRGIRIPHIDVDDAQKKIKIIDRISLAVYGKTAYFPEYRDVVEIKFY